MRKRIHSLLLPIAIACWLALHCARCHAQPNEIREGTSAHPRLTFGAAVRGVIVLNTPIDTRKLGKEMKCRKVIEHIYDELASRKRETVWIANPRAFMKDSKRFDLFEARVNLHRLPRYAPVGMVLQEMFDEAGCDGVVIVRSDCFELSTRKGFVTQPRLGFFCWTSIGLAHGSAFE
jgi:hypothetical protein